MAPVLCEDMPYAEAGGVAGWGNDSGTRGTRKRVFCAHLSCCVLTIFVDHLVMSYMV